MYKLIQRFHRLETDDYSGMLYLFVFYGTFLASIAAYLNNLSGPSLLQVTENSLSFMIGIYIVGISIIIIAPGRIARMNAVALKVQIIIFVFIDILN
jgi:hypothetical protein